MFHALKTKSLTYKSEKKFWGLSSRKKRKILEQAKPSVFADNYLTSIHSILGDLDFTGALFVGDGDFEFSTPKVATFGRSILNNEVYEIERGVSFSFPGLPAIQAFLHGNTTEAFCAADVTFAKLYSLNQSASVAELLCHASNLGIDLINTANHLLPRAADGKMGSALLERYHLGSENGFDPTFRFGMYENESFFFFQTLGDEGVNRGGEVRGLAGGGFVLKNGVTIYGKKGVDLDGPSLTLIAAELKSYTETSRKSASVGVTASGQVTDVDASVGHYKTKTTRYVNSGVVTDGILNLHHGSGLMDKIVLDGGNIIAGVASGGAHKTEMYDKQDRATSKSESISASSSGQVSYDRRRTKEVVTENQSGVQIVGDSLPTTFTLGEVTGSGGVIESTLDTTIVMTDKRESKELKDEHHKSGFGITMDLNEISELFKPRDPVTEQQPAKIKTFNLRYQTNHSDLSLDVPSVSYAGMKESVAPCVDVVEDNVKLLQPPALSEVEEQDKALTVPETMALPMLPIEKSSEANKLSEAILPAEEQVEEMSPDSKVIAETLPTPLVDSITTGVYLGACDVVEQAKELSILLWDVTLLSLTNQIFELSEPTMNAKARMAERGVYLYDFAASIGSFLKDTFLSTSALGLFFNEQREEAIDAMADRYDAIRTMLHEFYEDKPLENSARLATQLLIPYGALKGIKYFNQMRRMNVISLHMVESLSEPIKPIVLDPLFYYGHPQSLKYHYEYNGLFSTILSI